MQAHIFHACLVGPPARLATHGAVNFIADFDFDRELSLGERVGAQSAAGKGAGRIHAIVEKAEARMGDVVGIDLESVITRLEAEKVLRGLVFSAPPAIRIKPEAVIPRGDSSGIGLFRGFGRNRVRANSNQNKRDDGGADKKTATGRRVMQHAGRDSTIRANHVKGPPRSGCFFRRRVALDERCIAAARAPMSRQMTVQTHGRVAGWTIIRLTAITQLGRFGNGRPRPFFKKNSMRMPPMSLPKNHRPGKACEIGLVCFFSSNLDDETQNNPRFFPPPTAVEALFFNL